MIAELTQFFIGLFGVSLQSLPVILLVLLARMLLGHRAPARWRAWLWSLVLLRLLVPLDLLPSSSLSLENLWATSAVTRESPFPRESSAAAPPVLPLQPIRASAPFPAEDAPFEQTAFESAHLAPPFSPPEPERHPARSAGISASWPTLLALLWLGGIVAGGGFLSTAQIIFSRRVETQRVPIPESLAAAWLRVCEKMRVRRAPELQVSRAVASPVLFGLWRVRLVWPESRITGLAQEEYDHIFAHELGHFVRADHWLQALQLGTTLLHWFNPLVWYGLHCAEVDRELSADEWALCRLEGQSPTSYGKTLLKLVSDRSPCGSIPLTIGILEDSRQLMQRIKGILSFKRRRLIGSVLGLTALTVAAILVLSRSTEKTTSANIPTPALATALAPAPAPVVAKSPSARQKKQEPSPDEEEFSAIYKKLDSAADAERKNNAVLAIAIEKACYGEFLAFHEKWPESEIRLLKFNLAEIKADLAHLGDHTPLPDFVIKPGTYQHIFAATKMTIHQKYQRANGFLDSYLTMHCDIPIFRDYDRPLTSNSFKPDFTDVPLSQILDRVCRAHGFAYEVRDDGIHIRVAPMNLTRDPAVDNDTIHYLDPYHAITNPRRGWKYIDLHANLVRFPDSYETPLGTWIKFTGATGQVSYGIVSEYGTEHECIDYEIWKAMGWDYKKKPGEQPSVTWQIVPADQVPAGPWLQANERAPEFTRRWVNTLEISYTALAFATLRGSGLDRLKLLWETYSSPPSYCSPVTYAIYAGEPVSELDKLLALGNPLSAPQGEPAPLTMAAATGNLPAFEWLIQHGADPNLKPGRYDMAYGYGQYSPLDVACENGQADIVNYLLDHEKDIQPDQNFLGSLIHMEDTPANHDLIAKLAAAGLIHPLVVPTPDPKSKTKENPQLVQDRTDGENRYALYYAASEGKSDFLLETMLRQGFSPKGQIDRGEYSGLTIVQALQADSNSLEIENERFARVQENLYPEPSLFNSKFDTSSARVNTFFEPDPSTFKRRIAIIQKALLVGT